MDHTTRLRSGAREGEVFFTINEHAASITLVLLTCNDKKVVCLETQLITG